MIKKILYCLQVLYSLRRILRLLVGKYYDTFFLLKILKKNLPKGWKIYYKEHFATFSQIAFNVSPLRKDKISTQNYLNCLT